MSITHNGYALYIVMVMAMMIRVLLVYTIMPRWENRGGKVLIALGIILMIACPRLHFLPTGIILLPEMGR